MILKNFIAFFPIAVSEILLKTVKLKINEPVLNYIDENGLYHFTPNLDVAEQIKESGLVKQSSKFASYGNNVSFFFAGNPDLEMYMKNLSKGASNNLLIYPERVLYAVKLNIKKEQLANYKIRIQDGAIVHEGSCLLRDDQVEIKQMVLDLIEDKNGQKRLGLRERTEKEISEDNDIVDWNGKQIRVPIILHRNKPSAECLKAIEDEKRRQGYVMGGRLLGNTASVSHVLDAERRSSIQATKYILENIKKFAKNIMNKNVQALDENPNKKIKRVLQDIQYGRIDTRRSVRDKKYTNSIISLNKQGKTQKSSSEVMENLQNNKYYQYAGVKEKTLDKREIPNSKIHGINHSRRVVILESIILEELGVSFDERMADILITAGYKHDIGRILDVGPHAKRSVKKLKNMDLRHADGEEYSEEDRKLLYFLVEGHETPDKKTDKLLDKYGIEGEDKRNEYKLYLDVIKDADALDRARLSNKNMMDLNPKFLRLEPSKRLIDFSFDLEKLTTIVKDNSIMFYEPEIEKDKQNEFIEELKRQAEEGPRKISHERKTETRTRNVKLDFDDPDSNR